MPELRMILTAVAIMAPALAAAIAIKQKEARTISAAGDGFGSAERARSGLPAPPQVY